MKQLLNVEFLATHIEFVQAHQIATVHLHAAPREHPFLIGNITGIYQQMFRGVALLALVGTALHLVDVPSVTVAA